MIAIGLETSGKSFGLALMKEEILQSSLYFNSSLKHSDHLVSTINEFLSDNGITPKEIDLIAVDNGPGSFTGVRVGVSAGRAFAQILKKDLIGVSSLDALALSAKLWRGFIMAVIPAIKGEIYCAVYDNTEGLIKQYEPETLIEIKDLETFINKKSVSIKNLLICGPYADSLKHIVKNAEYFVCQPTAEEIVKLGVRRKLNSDKKFPWDEVLPNYIKQPAVIERQNSSK